MNDWCDYSLSNVLHAVDERAGAQDIDLVLSVTEKRGIVPQTEVFNKRIATSDVTKYKVLRPYDIAYNPYLLWTGAVGQWLGDTPGVTSPVYECFRVTPPHEPRFVGLLFESGLLTPYFDNTAVGSIQRRRRTTVAVFLAARVTLPDIRAQRRIVDLIAAIDAQIHSERTAGADASAVLLSLLSDHIRHVSGVERCIRDCCSHIVGGVWGEEQGVGDVDVAALGPRIYTPGTPGFVVEGSPIRSFSERQIESRLVRAGDIVLERSGGSPDQPVGRVVIASGGEEPCVPTDFQRLLRPDPSTVLPRYLFWQLWCDWRSGVTLGYSRRTTGITNLSVRDYLDRSLTLPTRTEQERIVATVDAAAEVAGATSRCICALSNLRACLLSRLLSGEIEIPTSYDAHLEAV